MSVLCSNIYKLGLCLGWKGQLICLREGREEKGRWGREGGEGDGGRVGRGLGGEKGRVGERGRVGREGRGGREGGTDDCYTYSNRYVQ